MIQRVTIGPVREDGRITGVAVTVEDVTARTEREKIAAHLSIRLSDPDWNARQSAVRDLADRGPAIVDEIVRTLREQHHNFSVLSSILDLLAIAEVDIVGPLIACLQEHDVDLRIQATLILGESRDRRAVPALMTALDDADVNVRFHAIEALGILRASDAVEKLVAIAAGGDFFLAFPAVHALSQIGDLSVAPQLVPLLKNDWLRAVVAEALGGLGDEVVVVPLVQLLNEPDCAAEVVADGLSGVWQRYEDRYGAGDHIANVVRRHITATGTQTLIDAVHRVGFGPPARGRERHGMAQRPRGPARADAPARPGICPRPGGRSARPLRRRRRGSPHQRARRGGSRHPPGGGRRAGPDWRSKSDACRWWPPWATPNLRCPSQARSRVWATPRRLRRPDGPARSHRFGRTAGCHRRAELDRPSRDAGTHRGAARRFRTRWFGNRP